MTKHLEVMEIIGGGKMALVASLPQNDTELARAAQNGGADMLKVHLNVRHAASGTYFGSLVEEKERILSIIETVDIPVGIMPGAGTPAPVGDMRDLREMGICFYDIYAADMPAEYLELEGMAAMAALDSGWREWQPAQLATLGVDSIEASIIPHDQYGKPLVLSDLLAYSFIVKEFGGPVIVPTQKAVKPGEVCRLSDAGVGGLMIGKIVAGDTPGSFEKATAQFARAIEDTL